MEQRGDLVTLQEERLWRGRAFDRDRGDLLRHRQVLRTSTCEKLKKRAQDCQPVIPRPPMIVSRGFEILQEPQDPIEREGVAGDLREPTGEIARDEHEKEAEGVSIRFDRRRPPPALDRELVCEEGLDQRADRGRHDVVSVTAA